MTSARKNIRTSNCSKPIPNIIFPFRIIVLLQPHKAFDHTLKNQIPFVTAVMLNPELFQR